MEMFGEFLGPAQRDPPLRMTPTIHAKSWDVVLAEVSRSTDFGVRGLVLKGIEGSFYWNAAPIRIHAMLIGAHYDDTGRRINESSFGVGREDGLISVAKVPLHRTRADFHRIEEFVNSHTLRRQGTFRSLEAELVCELGVQSIHKSWRHKTRMILYGAELAGAADMAVSESEYRANCTRGYFFASFFSSFFFSSFLASMTRSQSQSVWLRR